MKLDEKLKQKIDSYFENISADELYNILTKKYGFVDNIDKPIYEHKSFDLYDNENFYVKLDHVVYFKNLFYQQNIENNNSIFKFEIPLVHCSGAVDENEGYSLAA